VLKVHRYILRQVMFPLLSTLGIAALLLLLERMLRIFDFVINQGGPLSVVWRMLGNLIPHYLGLALPIGLFLGIQLGFRKLSLNSEIDALQSSGVGLNRLMPPLIALAFLLTAFSVALTGYIQPYSRYAYATLAFEVRSGTLGASIKAGEFTNIGRGITVWIEKASEGGHRLDNIFVEKRGADGRVTAISAASGTFFTTEDLLSLVLRLEDGTLLDLDATQPKPRVLTFKAHDLIVDLPTAASFRERGDTTDEDTLGELWQKMHQPRQDAALYAATFHARLARALSLLAIPFFAMPLGLVAKRSTSSIGITFGILVMLLLHKTVEFGEVSAGHSGSSVWLAIWLPVGLFFLLSLRLYYIGTHKVGGVPLQNLDRAWSASAAFFGSLFRRRRHG